MRRKDGPKPSRTLRRKLTFIAIALFLCLAVFVALIELTLSLFGVTGRWRLRVDPHADVVFLCVGDSHTRGLGAPKGFDYPAQLERRLQTADPARRYQALNLSAGGFNTSEAVSGAIEFLQRSERVPDILLFLAGYNNIWNLRQAAVLPEDERRRSRHRQYEFLLANSRSYRFGLVTVARLRQLAEGAKTANKKLFDLHEPGEISFLVRWVKLDLERLFRETALRKVPLVLLSYWDGNEWVDKACREFAADKRLPYLNLLNFGYDYYEGKCPSELVAPDCHPNQQGYARVAELIHQGLLTVGVLPLTDTD